MKTELIRRRCAASGLLLALVLAACSPESPSSLVAKGQADLANKDPRAAVVRFKAALQAEPGATATRVLLGRALLEAGDATGAAVELAKALESRADPATVMPVLGRAMIETGQFKRLIDGYATIKLADKPAQASFQTMLATAYSAVGDKPKAEAALAAALAAAPDFPDALVLQARILWLAGKLDEAIAMADKVLAGDAKFYKAWHVKGEALAAKQADNAAAEVALVKATEIEKSFVPAQSALVALRMRSGDIDGARRQLKVLQEVAPNSADAAFLAAQFAYFDKEFVKAREGVQQLLRVAPDNPNLLLLGAAIEWKIGSLVIAERMLSTALSVEPNLENARANLAYIYMQFGQPARALAILEPVLKNPKPNAMSLAAAGEASLQMGKPAAAETYYARAAAAAPDDQRTRTALAMAQLAKGDVGPAFAQLESLATNSKDGYADAALVSARLERRDLELALAAVDNMVRKSPNNAGAYRLRGQVLTAKGDLSGARQAFEKALSIEPRLFSVVVALADLDLRQDKADSAKARYAEAIKADPTNHEAVIRLADARLKTGEPPKDVAATVAEAVKALPQSSQLRLKLIELLSGQRQIKPALAAAQEASAAFPNDIQVLDALGRMLLADGNSQQALATFRRILTIDSNLPGVHVRMADVHRADGNLSAAAASFRRAIEIDPKQREARVALVELLVAQKRSKEALEIAKDLQRRDPDSPAGYLLEGAVHRKLLNHAASAAAYRLGMKNATDPADLPLNLFVALLASKNWKQAEAFALDWLDKHPGDGAVAYNLGEGYMMNKDFAAAEQYFSKAAAIRPDHMPTLNNLAWVTLKQGKPGAVQLARQAVRLSPNQPVPFDTLAAALMADKQPGPAIEAQKKAVSMAPGNPLFRLNLAKIALLAGDKALAKAELERLVAMGSRNPFQQEAVQLLKGV